jgi:hypothetical protein
MPSVIYEDSVTDAGSAIMGGTRVLYVAWEVTVQGPMVRNPVVWDETALVAVGNWSLGNDLSSGGLILAVGFDAPHWINREVGQWIVPPGQIGADFSAAVAQYFEWNLSPGTEVHFVVFGDV